MTSSWKNEKGFCLRGYCALAFLALLTAFYLFDVIGSAVTGNPVAPGTHAAFWSIIIVSAIITGISYAITNATQKKCPVCGQFVAKADRFCSKCGHVFHPAE